MVTTLANEAGTKSVRTKWTIIFIISLALWIFSSTHKAETKWTTLEGLLFRAE